MPFRYYCSDGYFAVRMPDAIVGICARSAGRMLAVDPLLMHFVSIAIVIIQLAIIKSTNRTSRRHLSASV